MSYIFAALLARFVLKEDISWFRWAGTAVITLGIIFIAFDGRQQSRSYRSSEKPQTFGGVGGEVAGHQHSAGDCDTRCSRKEGNS